MCISEINEGHLSSTVMDLVTLFQRVPPLLHACIDSNIKLDRGSDIAHLRALRLVNKECSRVAPLGLSAYTLTLKGFPGNGKDTHVGGKTTLLRHARLKSLEVNLLLSGEAS